MNRAIDSEISDLAASDTELIDEYAPGEPGASGDDIVAKAVMCVRRRWWYFLIVAAVAAGAAYPVAMEFGSDNYTAVGRVKISPLPMPPGEQVYRPPSLNHFQQYIADPRVFLRVYDKYGVDDPEYLRESLLKTDSNRDTGIATVEVQWDDADEAIGMVNDAIEFAIKESVQDRLTALNQSETFYEALLQAADLDVATLRAARRQKIESIRSEMLESAEERRDYEQLQATVRDHREALETLTTEKRRAEHRLKVIRQRHHEWLVSLRQDLVKSTVELLQQQIAQFAEGSAQRQNLQDQIADAEKLGRRDVESLEDLTEIRRELSALVGAELNMAEEPLNRLTNLGIDIRQTALRLELLPSEIKGAQERLDASISDLNQSVGMQMLSLEENPDIIELNSEIEWAEAEADKLRQMIVSIQQLENLDAASFEIFSPASEEFLVTDSNHIKFFAAAFAGIAGLLAAPMLLFDVLRPSQSPSEELSTELGLPTLSAQTLQRRSLDELSLEPNDEELRLLALRIQQTAKDTRGTAVLFSSLSDAISTDELTTTIGECLAARGERVLVIDLEPIAQHRQGRLARVRPALTDRSRQRDDQDQTPATVAAAINGQAAVAAPAATLNGHSYGNERGKVGLALALAGATSDPADVLLERREDGVDRLHLGEGELPVEAFASPLMAKLLDRYRTEYSMVLLSGPAAKHIADVQMLAARCDGTLFVAPRRGKLNPDARRTIVDLLVNRSPVLGVVQVPD